MTIGLSPRMRSLDSRSRVKLWSSPVKSLSFSVFQFAFPFSLFFCGALPGHSFELNYLCRHSLGEPSGPTLRSSKTVAHLSRSTPRGLVILWTLVLSIR